MRHPYPLSCPYWIIGNSDPSLSLPLNCSVVNGESVVPLQVLSGGGKGGIIIACGYLLGQVEVYTNCVIVKWSGTKSKYIIALEFAPKVINCDIVLLVVVVLVLVLRFFITAAPPPPLTVPLQPR